MVFFSRRKKTKEIFCDRGCKKSIKVSEIQLEEEALPGRSVFYFKCPHCDQRYDSYIKNSKGNIRGIGGNK